MKNFISGVAQEIKLKILTYTSSMGVYRKEKKALKNFLTYLIFFYSTWKIPLNFFRLCGINVANVLERAFLRLWETALLPLTLTYVLYMFWFLSFLRYRLLNCICRMTSIEIFACRSVWNSHLNTYPQCLSYIAVILREELSGQ